MDNLVENVATFLDRYASSEVIVFLISLLPVLELRGGLIAAKLFGVPWRVAAPLAALANIALTPFVIIFIERILSRLQRGGPFVKIARFIEMRGRAAGERILAKYPKSLFIGLLLFVAIPLPGTGVWTGGLIAALLGLDLKRGAPPICLGAIGACAAMSALVYAVPEALGY
ncbi:MAG: small multi-drug export protein [Clostridiales bacterium]|nr:small multi-drug export protein [Clostridiales bacterium]